MPFNPYTNQDEDHFVASSSRRAATAAAPIPPTRASTLYPHPMLSEQEYIGGPPPESPGTTLSSSSSPPRPTTTASSSRWAPPSSAQPGMAVPPAPPRRAVSVSSYQQQQQQQQQQSSRQTYHRPPHHHHQQQQHQNHSDDFYHSYHHSPGGGRNETERQMAAGLAAAAAAVDERHSISNVVIGRAPSLDFEFLWRRYHKARLRSRPDDELLSPARLEHMQNAQGFPLGLAHAILQHAQDCPIRVWILDNSGTMQCRDGHRVATTKTNGGRSSSSGRDRDRRPDKFIIQVVDCTRWEEVQSTVWWHAEMAAWCQTPLALRMVHDPGVTVGPQQVGVSASKTLTSVEELERLRRLLRSTRPSGGTTPMNQHLHSILLTVQDYVPRGLVDHYPPQPARRNPSAATALVDATTTTTTTTTNNKWLTLVICTDGLPTDESGQETPRVIEQFVKILLQLQELGVSTVIRLSTDEERVVQFYRTLDIGASSSSSSGSGTGAAHVHYQTRDGFTRVASIQPRATPESSRATPSSSTTTTATEQGRRPLPVLDDYVRECKDIQKHNPWLNYGLPLHLCREQGISTPVLEAMNRRPLQPMEVCQLIQLLFGQELPASALGAVPTANHSATTTDATTPMAEPPLSPALELRSYEEHLLQVRQHERAQQALLEATLAQQMDYKKFRSELESLNKVSGVLWNPVKQKFVPWMDLKAFDQLYKQNGTKAQQQQQQRKGGCIIS
jgi:hypothetical protein